jgi:hypothetical protein
VGLYCSLDCLAAAGGGLAAAEQGAGARLGLPAGAVCRGGVPGDFTREAGADVLRVLHRAARWLVA